MHSRAIYQHELVLSVYFIGRDGSAKERMRNDGTITMEHRVTPISAGGPFIIAATTPCYRIS